KPGDDFNEFANGAWSKRTVIPGDHSTWGIWDVLEEQSHTQVREILETAAHAHGPAGSNTQKIGDFYNTFMETAAIEKQGAAPLQAQLAAIKAIRDYPALAAALGQSLRYAVSAPVTVFVFVDFKNPDVYSPYLDQGGLGLPDRDYYLEDNEAMKAARAAY